jgi:hypothetical protein
MPVDYTIPPYHRVFYARGDIENAIRNAGFPAGLIATMTAIAYAESSGSNAIQKYQPYATTGWGCWQITPGNSVPSVGIDLALLDLHANARAAFVKWHSQGLHAWSTYTSGIYRKYL